VFAAPLQISTGFASWERYCTASISGRQAKLCGVEQRAPRMFGRATIRLGIGPHSSFTSVFYQVAQRVHSFPTSCGLLLHSSLNYIMVIVIHVFAHAMTTRFHFPTVSNIVLV